ncbi:MAG: glycosyltransferase [Pseudomonadota bacterium]
MRIVFATLGSLGDLFPMLALARAMQARGHDPLIAAPAAYGPRIADLGLPFHALRPDFSVEVLAQIFGDPLHGGKRLLADLVFPHARDTYTDLLEAARGADALVAGELVYVAPLVAQTLGIAWANVMLSPSTLMSALDPCVLTRFPAAYHLRHLGPWPQRLLFRLMRRATNAWGAPLRDLQHELGTSGGDIIFAGKFSPHLVLSLFPPAFGAVQADWPKASVQTGFAFFPQAIDPATAARIQAFVTAGPPPVVFTLGTTVVHLAQDFYQTAADAALALGRRAILLLGKNPPPRAPTDQILSLDYAPHASVFAQAAAVVQHGGVGGCAEALRAGVPALTIPVGFDQPDNAARLRRMGVSAILSHRDVSPATLKHALGRVLDDSAMAARAKAFAAAMDPERDMSHSLDAIEALVRSPPSKRAA